MKKTQLLIVLFLLSSSAFSQKKEFLKKDFTPNSRKNNKVIAQSKSYDYLWSDDFSDPNTWIIEHDAVACNLDWQIGAGLSMQGTATITNIASTTASNGFAMVDSDFYGGEEGGSDVEDSWFTTANSIDLSANPNVLLEFETWYRKYNSETCFVVTSTNNTDWPELTPDFDASTNDNVYEVFPGIANVTSLPENPTLTKLNISASAGGEAQVWVRFHWTGTWGYAWFVDDVAIVNQPADDIVLNSAWISNTSGYEYGRVPEAHLADSIVIGGEVFNFGVNTQTNIEISMNINDASGASLVTESADFESLESDSTDLRQLVMTGVPLSEGMYQFSTTVRSDDDNANGENFFNNTYTRDFALTENLYAIDGIGIYNDDIQNFATRIGTNYGNGTTAMVRYELLEETTVVGLEIALSSSTDAGAQIFPFLVDAADINNLSSSNRLAENQDGVIVHQSNIDNNIIYVELETTTLDAGVYYACAELYNGPNEDDRIYILNDATVAQPTDASMICVQDDFGPVNYTNGNATAVRLVLNEYGELNPIYGCTDVTANNFNSSANTEDGSCDYSLIYGCTNNTATNYNPLAVVDDESCIIYGCTLPEFPNYNPEATINDSSCSLFTPFIYGCTDVNSIDYDPLANIDNGSCTYDVETTNSTEGFEITLLAGWNLFGFSCLEPRDVAQALSSLTDFIVVVKDNLGEVYLPAWDYNGIGNLQGGYGYQIKITEQIDDFNICED